MFFHHFDAVLNENFKVLCFIKVMFFAQKLPISIWIVAPIEEVNNRFYESGNAKIGVLIKFILSEFSVFIKDFDPVSSGVGRMIKSSIKIGKHPRVFISSPPKHELIYAEFIHNFFNLKVKIEILLIREFEVLHLEWNPGVGSLFWANTPFHTTKGEFIYFQPDWDLWVGLFVHE